MAFESLMASTISGINRLPAQEKRTIYSMLIPPELLERFRLNPYFMDTEGRDLLKFPSPGDGSDVEMELRHKFDAPDPVLYGHLADTVSGMVHILLYMLNDPDFPRFDVDRMPDGTSTQFGTHSRNLPAELAALQYGLSPGQIRRGLRLLGPAIKAFEQFILALNYSMYLIEPLFYHNAIIFERYGFAYSKGRKLMDRIQQGFAPGGDLISQLDPGSSFRSPLAQNSIRLRSWAIHDGILGEPFTDVTMYKDIEKPARLNTSLDCEW